MPAAVMQNNDASFNWASLQNAFLNGTWDCRFYFDKQTGDVHQVAEQTREALQQIYDEVGEEAADGLLTSAEMQLAHAIEMDDIRYHAIPVCKPAILRQWQDSFAETADPTFRRLLWTALDHNDNARFNRLLALEPAEQQRWTTELAKNVREQLSRWLLSCDGADAQA